MRGKTLFQCFGQRRGTGGGLAHTAAHTVHRAGAGWRNDGRKLYFLFHRREQLPTGRRRRAPLSRRSPADRGSAARKSRPNPTIFHGALVFSGRLAGRPPGDLHDRTLFFKACHFIEDGAAFFAALQEAQERTCFRTALGGFQPTRCRPGLGRKGCLRGGRLRQNQTIGLYNSREFGRGQLGFARPATAEGAQLGLVAPLQGRRTPVTTPTRLCKTTHERVEGSCGEEGEVPLSRSFRASKLWSCGTHEHGGDQTHP